MPLKWKRRAPAIGWPGNFKEGRAQARHAPELGLRVVADTLPVPDAPAAVSAALRPRRPGRPRPVDGVGGVSPRQQEIARQACQGNGPSVI